MTGRAGIEVRGEGRGVRGKDREVRGGGGQRSKGSEWGGQGGK